MTILDTDHSTVLWHADGVQHRTLSARLDDAPEKDFVLTVVTAEEQLRGWLAEINRWREVQRQIMAYDRLVDLIDFLADWELVRIDDRAAERFEDLRRQRVRIGTQDLKIAAIALANDALLLTANLRDFRRVPGLRVENWLE